MNSDTLKGQWKQVVGQAKQKWSKLTDDDLLHLEGNVQNLAGLIQQHYGTARAEAERQVTKFIEGFDTKKSSAGNRTENAATYMPPPHH